jgi:hypothetical protein
MLAANKLKSGPSSTPCVESVLVAAVTRSATDKHTKPESEQTLKIGVVKAGHV